MAIIGRLSGYSAGTGGGGGAGGEPDFAGLLNEPVATLADLEGTTVRNVQTGDRIWVRSFSGVESMGFYLRVGTSTGHEMRGTSNAGSVQWTFDEREIWLEMCGGVPDFNPGTQAGTDNRLAILRALAAQAALDRPIRIGKGRFRYDGNLDLNQIATEIHGAGAYHEDGTQLICGALSGIAMTVGQRSTRLTGFRLGATTARRALGNPTTGGAGIEGGHGLVIGRDEAGASASRLEIDILVLGHPTDGVRISAGVELMRDGQITSQDNCRHGFVIDDEFGGSTTLQSFACGLTEWRAIENGGHALVNLTQSKHLEFKRLQALGNLWKREHNLSTENGIRPQIISAASDELYYTLDCEDQQYANTVSIAGNARLANAAPAGGIELRGTQQRVEGGHFSSVHSVVDFTAGGEGSSAKGMRVFEGAYGVKPAAAARVFGGAQNASILMDVTTSSVAVVKPVHAIGRRHRIFVDGAPHRSLNVSAGDLALIEDHQLPWPQEINAGTLSMPLANRIEVQPRFANTWVENLGLMFASPDLDGVPIEITIPDGYTFNFNSNGVSVMDEGAQVKGFTLGASPRVMTGGVSLVVSYNKNTGRYSEIFYGPSVKARSSLIASLEAQSSVWSIARAASGRWELGEDCFCPTSRAAYRLSKERSDGSAGNQLDDPCIEGSGLAAQSWIPVSQIRSRWLHVFADDDGLEAWGGGTKGMIATTLAGRWLLHTGAGWTDRSRYDILLRTDDAVGEVSPTLANNHIALLEGEHDMQYVYGLSPVITV